MRLWAARRLARSARSDNMVVTAEAEEPLAFASLPVDLLCSVAEELDVQSLASFAAASSACRAVAHEPLREALLKVLKRCLRGVRNLPPNPNRAQLTSAWETETFKGCGKNLQLLLLGHLTDVASVGDYAFRDCGSLSRCVLPGGLVTIGKRAFERCTSLAKLTLPATLTSIGESAFRGCYSLTSLTLPASLVTIGDDAFHGCYALASVKFPASLVTIGLDAFRDCSSLTSLTFPASLVTIGLGAFAHCSSLTSVDFTAVTDANIGHSAFHDCERLVKVTLPAALSRIDDSTFSRCSALVELTLPTTLTSIGKMAFVKCKSLAELTLPATLTSIDVYAFCGCSSLTSLTFTASLSTIGLSAVDDGSSLTNVDSCPAASQLTHVGDEAHGHLNPRTQRKHAYIDTIHAYAGDCAFDECTSLAKLIVHDGLIPKDLREARTRATIDLLHRLLKRSGAKPVPKAAKLTWPASDTLASIGSSASRVYPRLAKLPSQPRRLHYRRRVRLLLQRMCKSELEIWISGMEI